MNFAKLSRNSPRLGGKHPNEPRELEDWELERTDEALPRRKTPAEELAELESLL